MVVEVLEDAGFVVTTVLADEDLDWLTLEEVRAEDGLVLEVFDTEAVLVDCERVPVEEILEEVLVEETVGAELVVREAVADEVALETEIVVLETGAVEADVLRLETEDKVFEDAETEPDLL
ncbi:hypothetical protein LTR84_010479 [Exophiala bonariae]|uniref:Uncharacterized protein n=1 Tax=Exophiala bonariae TaxID=1690606 RepID=A0AAV9MT76_9EURO|nr:hypothetical protein LTR84_010479 [Exophiala bonariae]